MKHLIFVLFAFCLSLNASASMREFAGPIASGGIPETDFQHDRAAILTILETDEVLSALQNKGSILNITPVEGQHDVYAVTTEKCELHVKFVRTVEVIEGLPRADYSANVLWDESKGDCQ